MAVEQPAPRWSQYKVLLLNSYHPGMAWSDNVTHAALSSLKELAPDAIPYVEYMDSKRYHAPDYLLRLLDLYRAKYKDAGIDVILCSDDNALNFLLKWGEELFPGVPIVFCGANDYKPEELRGHKNITGVAESIRVKPNLELIARLLPNVTKIIAFRDSTVTGRLIMDRLKKAASAYQGRFTFEYLEGLPLNKLLEKLKGAGENTAIVDCGYCAQPEGKIHSMDWALNRIQQHGVTAPIFTFWPMPIINGHSNYLGGYMIDDTSQGRLAAEMVAKILRGIPVDQIPVIPQGPSLYLFDAKQLKKFNIHQEKLPPGSRVANQETTFFDRHETVLRVSGAIITILLFFIASLIVNILTRKRDKRVILERENQYIAIFNSVSDSIVVVDFDGGVLDANQRAVAMFGDKLVGASARFASIFSPECQEEGERLLRDTQENGSCSGEITGQGADGEKIDLERYAVKFSYRDKLCCLVSLRDIRDRKKAERETRFFAERLKNTVANLPMILFAFDGQGKFTIAEGGRVREIERHRGTLIGQSCAEVFHDTPEIVTRCERALHGEGFSGTVAFPNGRHYNTSYNPIYDDQGRIREVIGVAVDITSRVRAEIALRDSEEKARAILDSTAEAICGLDMDFNITFANASCFKLLDIQDETEFIGRPFQSLIIPNKNALSGDDILGVFQTRDEERSYEVSMRRGDSAFLANLWLHPVKKGGERVGAVASFLDISEKARLTERLILEIARQKTILDNNLVGVCLIENDSFVRANDKMEEMLRLPKGSLRQKSIFKVLDWKEYRHQARRLFKLLRDDGVVREEAKLTRPDGSVFWCSFNGQALDPQNPNKGSTWILEDVTNRKESEAKLRRIMEDLANSNKELERFAYVASHDLQEPLRAVAGYMQLLERRYADALPEEGRRFAKKAVESAARMSELINDLLAYSRVGTRKKPMVPTDLNMIAQAAMENLRATISNHDATIEIDSLPTLTVDSNQMTRLFQNLLSNGIKFHREEVAPRLRVSATREDTRWLFRFEDNGIGIAQEHLERIFVIFQRLHTRQEYSGTGIGLAICEKIVRRHGGKIWAESTIGQGSALVFSLPVELEDPTPREESAS